MKITIICLLAILPIPNAYARQTVPAYQYDCAQMDDKGDPKKGTCIEPAGPMPKGCVSVEFNGKEFVCEEPGDTSVKKREAEQTQKAQEYAEKVKALKLNTEKRIIGR